MEINMTNKKCDVFQSTYLGDPKDPNKDHDWENMWQTIQNGKQPFKYMDRLEIAFADIHAEDPDNPYLSYTGPNLEKANQTIAEAKKENPAIEIIAQMGWASGLKPLVEDPVKAEERLDRFAKKIPPFLNEYSLHGIDFDWESVPDELTTESATFLFTQTREYLNADKIKLMTITPDGAHPTGQSLDICVVNQLFDAVIVQSYQRLEYIDNYVKAGINPSIMFCGMCAEVPFYPPGGDISEYIKRVGKYHLPGLYNWRVDNDDTDLSRNVPRYTITSKMWEYSRGSLPEPPLYP
jgi:Glycosyl hydrolases family 18